MKIAIKTNFVISHENSPHQQFLQISFQQEQNKVKSDHATTELVSPNRECLIESAN